MIIRIICSRFARQLAAVIAVGLALLVRIALAKHTIILPTYITFYPVVILGALLDGVWTGILTTALSALLVDYAVLAPTGSFFITSISDIVAMAIFCFSGISISLVTGLYHRSQQRLAAYQLEAAVLNERNAADEARMVAESAHAERKRLLDVLETLPVMISLVTPDHRIAYANRSYREKFGDSQDKNCYEVRFGRTEPCDSCDSFKVLESGKPLNREVTFKDGSLIESYDFPLTGWDGTTLILKMDTDITERRRIEAEIKAHREHLEALVSERTRQLQIANAQLEVDIREREQVEQNLRESRAKLEAALASMTDSVIITDADGRFVDFNDAYARFCRFESKAECASSFSEFTNIFEIFQAKGVLLPKEQYATQRALRGETATNVEFILRRKDSGESWIGSSSFGPIRDKDGAISGAVITSRDITEAKRAEQALRESEELLGLFVEYAPVALAMFDDQMRYLYASLRWKAEYGLGDRKLRGLSHYDEFPEIPDPWREAHRRGLAGEVLSGEADRFERTDGSEQWVRWGVRPWRNAEGKVGGIVIFSEDITEHRQAEETLRQKERETLQRQQLQALAERLQEAREEERTRVARDLHDQIGQILTAIKMDLAWIERRLPESQSEMRNRLKETSELINDGVKSVRKICAGLRPGILDDLGLAAAIEWQSNEFAARTGIYCKLSLLSSDLKLDGDRATAVFRIFQECLTNIARHAEARTVSTSLYLQDENLMLVVQDDGKGFVQSEVASSLGVLGMKERAQVCGGSVKIAGSPGNGTTVTVCIPVSNTSAGLVDDAYSDR